MSTTWTFIDGVSDENISAFSNWNQDVSLEDTGLLMIAARLDSYTPPDASSKITPLFAIYRMVDVGGFRNADLIMTLTYSFDDARLYGSVGTVDLEGTGDVNIAMTSPGWGALILNSNRKNFTVASYADDPSLGGSPITSASAVSPVEMLSMNNLHRGIGGGMDEVGVVHDGFAFYSGVGDPEPPPGVIIGQQWPRGMKSKFYGGSRLS